MSKNSKKESYNNKNVMNIIRWTVLIPCVILTWYSVIFLLGLLGHWFLVNKIWMLLPWDVLEIPVTIIFGAGIPAAIMFYIAYIIAPTHKILVGWMAVVSCVLISLLAVYGLLHMGY